MALQRDTNLLDRIEQLGRISREEAAQHINAIYSDGLVSRVEAEGLFRLRARLQPTTPDLDARFIEVICDFLLEREAPIGWISEGEGNWLIAELGEQPEAIDETEMDLLLALLRLAEGAPRRLARFALQAACARIISAGRADSEEVERVRRAIFAQASEDALWVSRFEAASLMRTNDAIARARNAPGWNALFARAIANHLLAAAHPDPMTEARALARETWLQREGGGVFAGFREMLARGDWFARLTHDPGQAAAARKAALNANLEEGAQVTPAEGAWLMRRLGWDNDLSPAEKALVAFLKAEAPGFVDGLTVAV